MALVEPAGQAYPAVQTPLQLDDVSPVVLPNAPALHRPLQLALVSPELLPYTPAGHALHDPDPITLYVPTPHSTAVLLMEPAGHAYPALHGPVQSDDV